MDNNDCTEIHDYEEQQYNEPDDRTIVDDAENTEHIVQQEHLVEESFLDVTINGFEEQHTSGKPRRNVKRPEQFTVLHEGKKRRHKSTTRKGTNRKKSKSRSSIPADNLQFEIDYIFGKRPDRKNKGKFEYRVFWKGFTLNDASWEPEDSLRGCRESILAYEKKQHLSEGPTDSEDNDSEDAVAINDSNSNNKKNGRGRSMSTARMHNSDSNSSTVSKQPLATMRARASSIGASSTINKKKQKRHNKRGGSKLIMAKDEHKTPSPIPLSTLSKRAVKRKGGKLSPEEAKSQMTNKIARTSMNRTVKEHSFVNSEIDIGAISFIQSVHPSAIQGVNSPLADVIMEDGSTRSVTVEWLKENKNMDIMLMLTDCYENMLGFNNN